MLDEKHTCFVRDGKTFCKKDYIRYFMLHQVVVAVVSLYQLD